MCSLKTSATLNRLHLLLQYHQLELSWSKNPGMPPFLLGALLCPFGLFTSQMLLLQDILAMTAEQHTTARTSSVLLWICSGEACCMQVHLSEAHEKTRVPSTLCQGLTSAYESPAPLHAVLFYKICKASHPPLISSKNWSLPQREGKCI